MGKNTKIVDVESGPIPVTDWVEVEEWEPCLPPVEDEEKVIAWVEEGFEYYKHAI